MIKLQIIGSLGKDCIVKEVNGKNVINFSVASSEKWTDAQGNKQERTTWVEAAYWTEKTGISPYLLKGTKVYVEGKPEADAYLSNGEARGTLRVRVERIELVGGQQQSNGQATSKPQTQAAPSTPMATDDLPF